MTNKTDGAAKMDTSASPITTTMTIGTCGANDIISSPPSMKNKGRVNHTVGVNLPLNASSPIVSERVNSCTDATGPTQPIMITAGSSTANAPRTLKRVGELLSCNKNNVKYSNNVNHDNTNYSTTKKEHPTEPAVQVQVSMPLCNTDQVSSPKAKTVHSAHNKQQAKDTFLVTPQECELTNNSISNKDKNSINSNNQVLDQKTPERTTTTNGTNGTMKPLNKTFQLSKDKTEQKYDMNLVPMVKRNPEFLRKWRQATLADASCPVFSSLPNLVPCDTLSLCDASTDSKSTTSDNLPCSSSSDQADQDHNISNSVKPCHHDSCDIHSQKRKHDQSRTTTAYIPRQIVSPFAEDCESCIWAPSSRSDWEDSIDELVNVCTAAAWHRERSSQKKKSKEFSPPISHIYVKDRIDIDDPLRGYQIRHKTGGWLQGFVMMTNFTIWTHYFKWDSTHPTNGIDRDNVIGAVDDGNLTKELESQPRSGDPHGAGVVWPSIAEISLVGALGCGEYLVQMALDDIERKGTYQFAVLEATETSRPFYEKFGFVRVGAVCKYGKEEDFENKDNEVKETGYRHWTYANETKARLNEHGGPSCMMARRIKRLDNIGRSHCQSCGKPNEFPSFIDNLANYFVSKKPRIQPLGTSGYRKRSRTTSIGSLAQGTGEKSSKMAKVVKERTTSSGRQTRTPTRLDESEQSLPSHRPKTQSIVRSSRNSTVATAAPPVVLKSSPVPRSGIKPILRKQKIANMYRDPKKTYYYNKVVTPRPDGEDRYNYKSQFYFVLNFEEDVKLVRLIPLYKRGTFKGKREGREKWKAAILPRHDGDEKKWLKSMDVITAPASKWNIVPSYMVTKCSNVAEESWDILF